MLLDVGSEGLAYRADVFIELYAMIGGKLSNNSAIQKCRELSSAPSPSILHCSVANALIKRNQL
jgi:hypothetical protein